MERAPYYPHGKPARPESGSPRAAWAAYGAALRVACVRRYQPSAAGSATLGQPPQLVTGALEAWDSQDAADSQAQPLSARLWEWFWFAFLAYWPVAIVACLALPSGSTLQTIIILPGALVILLAVGAAYLLFWGLVAALIIGILTCNCH